MSSVAPRVLPDCKHSDDLCCRLCYSQRGLVLVEDETTKSGMRPTQLSLRAINTHILEITIVLFFFSHIVAVRRCWICGAGANGVKGSVVSPQVRGIHGDLYHCVRCRHFLEGLVWWYMSVEGCHASESPTEFRQGLTMDVLFFLYLAFDATFLLFSSARVDAPTQLITSCPQEVGWMP
jgi:hypothetical protein